MKVWKEAFSTCRKGKATLPHYSWPYLSFEKSLAHLRFVKEQNENSCLNFSMLNHIFKSLSKWGWIFLQLALHPPYLTSAETILTYFPRMYLIPRKKHWWISIIEVFVQTAWVMEKPVKYCSCRIPGMDFLTSLVEYFTEEQSSQAHEKYKHSHNSSFSMLLPNFKRLKE